MLRGGRHRTPAPPTQDGISINPQENVAAAASDAALARFPCQDDGQPDGREGNFGHGAVSGTPRFPLEPGWRQVVVGRAAGGCHRPGGARRRGVRVLRHAGAVPRDQHADLGLWPGVRRPLGGAAARRLRTLLPPPAYTLIDDRVHELVSQTQRHAEHQPHRQPDRRLLERLGGHQVGAVGAERRLRHGGAARHPGVPARRPGDDAVRGGRGGAGDRGAGVPADGDLVRRPLRLQRGADQRVQPDAAGRAGRRHDRAALPLRAVAHADRRSSGSFPAPCWPRCCG